MRSFILTTLVGLLFVNETFSLDKQRDCKCRIQTNRRIIGGRNANLASYPWQVSLLRKEEKPVADHLRRNVPDSEKTKYHACGGTIISEFYILTAAHCVDERFAGKDGSKIHIGYGENDLAQIYNKKKYAEIEAVYQHQDFGQFFEIVNDIAIVKLKEPLVFDQSVQPACLGTDHRFFYEGVLKIAGWGSTSVVYINGFGRRSGVNIPRFLKEGEVYDHSNEVSKCEKPEQNICVLNDQKKGESVCLGDSGGPIHYTQNGKSSVVGVTSFVNVVRDGMQRKVCAGISSFTRVSSFSSWIEGIVGDEHCT